MNGTLKTQSFISCVRRSLETHNSQASIMGMRDQLWLSRAAALPQPLQPNTLEHNVHFHSYIPILKSNYRIFFAPTCIVLRMRK